jgi:predicted transglutaminase-like cysteine proteinase
MRPYLGRCAGPLAAALSCILIACAAHAAGETAVESPRYPALFGSREVQSGNLAPFQKWTGMLARQVNERVLYDGPCGSRRFNRCHLQEWRRLLAEVATKDRRAQLEAVNNFMNGAPYITDPVNYGVPDYWATPLQFLGKNGDCEDYAIAKFISLRELGFDNSELRIVIVDDVNLRVPHAVLAVYLDSRILVLDNQIPRVISAELVRHYRPIYSINEDRWWRHQP